MNDGLSEIAFEEPLHADCALRQALSAEGEAMSESATWRYRWYRFASRLRCVLGIHRLVGHIDCGDGVNVADYNPHAARPARGAWRVCSWCGARWVAAYDGIAPFWWRKR